MEETVGSGRYCLITVYTAGTDYTDRWLLRSHHSRLHRRRMRAEQHIRCPVDKEGILHIARRMIGREIKRLENMPVIFDLRTLGNREAKTAEYIDNLLAHERQRMTCADIERSRRTRQVKLSAFVIAAPRRLAKSVDTLGGVRLQLIESLSELPFHRSVDIAEIIHQRRDGAFLAQIFYAQGLYCFGIGCLGGFKLGADSFNLFYHRVTEDIYFIAAKIQKIHDTAKSVFCTPIILIMIL